MDAGGMVYTWGGNKSCCLGIGPAVLQAQPTAAGTVATPPRAVAEARLKRGGGVGGGVGKVGAMAGRLASFFEGQIRNERADAERDSEARRPEARANLANSDARPMPQVSALAGRLVVRVAMAHGVIQTPLSMFH
jgi:hypothetical protein